MPCRENTPYTHHIFMDFGYHVVLLYKYYSRSCHCSHRLSSHSPESFSCMLRGTQSCRGFRQQNAPTCLREIKGFPELSILPRLSSAEKPNMPQGNKARHSQTRPVTARTILCCEGYGACFPRKRPRVSHAGTESAVGGTGSRDSTVNGEYPKNSLDR